MRTVRIDVTDEIGELIDSSIIQGRTDKETNEFVKLELLELIGNQIVWPSCTTIRIVDMYE